MRLNLGSANREFPGFLSVDFTGNPYIRADLRIRWPWPDSSVDEVKAFDIVEHLPDRIHTMNELWRVLKHGARAEIIVPNASHGAGAFQDPQHCSYWTLNSFQYFQAGSYAVERLAASYGIVARFRVIELSEEMVQDVKEAVWKIHCVLEAVKL